MRFAGLVSGGQVNLMENGRSATPDKNGTCRIPVTPFPLFIRGRPGTLKSLCNALNSAYLLDGHKAPIEVSAKPLGASRLAVQFRNLLSRPIKTEATLTVQAKR